MDNNQFRLAVLIGVQLIFLGLWFGKLIDSLSKKARVFWTIVIIMFFLPIDLFGLCVIGRGGLGCIGLSIFEIPFTVSALLLIVGSIFLVVRKFVGNKVGKEKN